MARSRIKFQGLPARICWIGLGDRARAVADYKAALALDPKNARAREALSALGAITGETATEELLDRIFATFCVGK